MSRFQLNAISSKIAESIIMAEGLLVNDSRMITYIRSRNNWKYNSGSGEHVATELLKIRTPVSVYLVKATRKTSAVAYYQYGDIYFYDHYINHPATDLKEIAGTLIHEWSHKCGFNHNSPFMTSNFKTQAKIDFSVPYNLSENIKEWL